MAGTEEPAGQHHPGQPEDEGDVRAPEEPEDPAGERDEKDEEERQSAPYGPYSQTPYGHWGQGRPSYPYQNWAPGRPPYPYHPHPYPYPHQQYWAAGSRFPRPRVPLPQAPGWLPAAVLGVGVVAALLATLDRPGLGLVVTAVVAALTAFTALMVRPAIPESALGGDDSNDGEKTGAEAEGGTEQAGGESTTDEESLPPATAAEDTEECGETAERSDAATAASTRPDRYTYAWSAVYAGIAAALLFTALFRDAGWVLVWTLSAALLFASLAFATRNPASRRNTVSVSTGALALFRNAVDTPKFLLQPVQASKARGKLLPVLVTAGITAALLLVFGLLFAFADPVFSAFLTGLLPSFQVSDGSFRSVFAMAVTMLLTGAAVLTSRRHHPEPAREASASSASSNRRNVPAWTWVVPLGALVLLFAAFLGVQAVAMFGGDDYVQRVAGVSYADYARQGFFQLVVVSILVLGVVVCGSRLLPSRPAATRTLRNAVLGLLCVLTLVILASAMMRLQLYIDTFGLTRMRITAEAWIVWSAVVFGLVIAAGILNTLGRPAKWLPRVTVALAGVALVVFAYANPDLRIADSHHDVEVSSTDARYLRGLSSDALPGLVELEGRDRDCAVEGLGVRLNEPDGFASWNFSRHRARGQLEEADLLQAPGSADSYSACAPR